MAHSDKVFSAIADPRRRAILEFLRTGDQTAGEVADRFDVSWPAVSRHLRVLKTAGLIQETRYGRNRVYGLKTPGLVALVGSWVNQFGAGSRSVPPPSSTPGAQSPISVGREYTS